MSNHRLISIILAAGVALPASLGTSLAAEQPSPEDITLKSPRVPRGLSLIVDASKLAVEAVELVRPKMG